MQITRINAAMENPTINERQNNSNPAFGNATPRLERLVRNQITPLIRKMNSEARAYEYVFPSDLNALTGIFKAIQNNRQFVVDVITLKGKIKAFVIKPLDEELTRTLKVEENTPTFIEMLKVIKQELWNAYAHGKNLKTYASGAKYANPDTYTKKLSAYNRFWGKTVDITQSPQNISVD